MIIKIIYPGRTGTDSADQSRTVRTRAGPGRAEPDSTGGSRGGANMAMPPPQSPGRGGQMGIWPPKTHDFLENFLKLFFSKVNFGQSQKIVD